MKKLQKIGCGIMCKVVIFAVRSIPGLDFGNLGLYSNDYLELVPTILHYKSPDSE